MAQDSWMGDLIDDGVDIRSMTLRELAWPGTHDTATFDIEIPVLKDILRCQASTIKEQLDFGVRFMDLRFVRRDDEYFAHHSIIDMPTKLEEVMSDVRAFLSEPRHDREVLILRVSHLKGVDDAATERDLLTRVTGPIAQWCAPRPQPRSVENATGTTLGALLDEKKQVVLVFQHLHVSDAEVEGEFPIWCNDEDTDRLLTMDTVWGNTEEVSDLLQKLPGFQDQEAHEPSLFVLQTVLTPQLPNFELEEMPKEILHLFEHGEKHLSVEHLSQLGNEEILTWVAGPALQRRVNIVFMNFVGQDFTKTNDGRDLIQVVSDINRDRAGGQ